MSEDSVRKHNLKPRLEMFSQYHLQMVPQTQGHMFPSNHRIWHCLTLGRNRQTRFSSFKVRHLENLGWPRTTPLSTTDPMTLKLERERERVSLELCGWHWTPTPWTPTPCTSGVQLNCIAGQQARHALRRGDQGLLASDSDSDSDSDTYISTGLQRSNIMLIKAAFLHTKL